MFLIMFYLSQYHCHSGHGSGFKISPSSVNNCYKIWHFISKFRQIMWNLTFLGMKRIRSKIVSAEVHWGNKLKHCNFLTMKLLPNLHKIHSHCGLLYVLVPLRQGATSKVNREMALGLLFSTLRTSKLSNKTPNGQAI